MATKPIGARVEEDVINRVVEMARKFKRSKSKQVEYLLEIGLASEERRNDPDYGSKRFEQAVSES